MKSSCQKTTTFLLNVQKWLRKRKFCLKKLFPSKMCLRTQKEQFWQLRRETFNDRQSNFRSRSGKYKKNFNLNNASKSFYGHVASILTSPLRNLQKSCNFSTQNTHRKPLQMKDCYSEGSYGHLDCSFDNPAKKLSEGQKFCSMSEKYGKKEKVFK